MLGNEEVVYFKVTFIDRVSRDIRLISEREWVCAEAFAASLVIAFGYQWMSDKFDEWFLISHIVQSELYVIHINIL